MSTARWTNDAARVRAMDRRKGHGSRNENASEEQIVDDAAADVNEELPGSAPSSASERHLIRQLSARGKAKLQQLVQAASTFEELADIEGALDGGEIDRSAAQRLGLEEHDFQSAPLAPVAEATTASLEPPRRLSASGLLKVRKAIESATDMNLLAVIDEAMTRGDVARLTELLHLDDSDIQQDKVETDGAFDDEASTEPSETEGEEDEYDPFATEPQPQQAAATPSLEPELRTTAPVVVAPAVLASDATACAGRPPLPPGPPPQPKAGGLGALQSAYDDSSSDENAERAGDGTFSSPQQKRRRTAGACDEAGDGEGVADDSKVLAWPLEWAWLLSRSMGHQDFRPPPRLPSGGTREADAGEHRQSSAKVAIATSLVYVGDATSGYDPRHLGRVVAVNEQGDVLLDVMAKPRAPVLDCRGHITGLTREALVAESAREFDSIRDQLLGLLHPQTLLVGWRLCNDLEVMQLWHGPLVDVALLFGVDSRKQHQYHPLRHIAAHVLRVEVDLDGPQDALESARLAMRLARHEAKQPTPTPSFPPHEGKPLELLVRHIPREWGRAAATRLRVLFPAAQQDITVHWILNDSDPTDWRGEAALVFPDTKVRDASFEALKALTDIHIQWEDAPGAPPLGAFMTEHSLVKAFSTYGPVVAARIPRKPTTREPQSFAFVSFAAREDAQRVARQSEIDVELTPTWTLRLKPRLAKFGHATDKRVAIQALGAEAPEFALDYVHVCRR